MGLQTPFKLKKDNLYDGKMNPRLLTTYLGSMAKLKAKVGFFVLFIFCNGALNFTKQKKLIATLHKIIKKFRIKKIIVIRKILFIRAK